MSFRHQMGLWAVVLGITSLCWTVNVSAQEGEPISPADETYQQALAARTNETDLLALNIVYFRDPTAPNAQGDFINDATITETFGATMPDSWDEFAESLDEAGQPDIVLIHTSAAGWVDTEWTQAAYREGVLLVGLSMPFEEMQRITGDYCQNDPNPGYLDYYPEMALYFLFDVTLTPGIDRAAIERATLETCPGEDVVKAYSVEHGVVNTPIVASLGDTLAYDLRFDVAKRLLVEGR